MKLTVKGQYLAKDGETPFFFLADTAWELAHALNREEVETYFCTRAEEGFDASQVVALAELEGLTTPNAYGRLPLLSGENGLPDPTRPDLAGEYSYWDHLDYIADVAEKYGMFLFLLPTWGDKYNLKWGKGPEVFTVENARVYGKWIGARYADRDNIVWMLGGDRPLETPTHRAVIDAMAEGIRESDARHLITFHPCGERNSTMDVPDAPYIDIHSAQTGHSVGQAFSSDRVMLEMRKAGKPYFDSEPRYEDHPACFRAAIGYYWDADDVRVNAYRDVLAGACGHTYGHHSVWSVNRQPTDYFPVPYADALTRPGAKMIRHLKTLRLSRDFFSLVPKNDAVLTEYGDNARVTAAMGKDYLFAYSPLGLPFTLDYALDAKAVKASWFDPRTGGETLFSVLPAKGKATFAPPACGKGNDWILILDAVPREILA